MAHQILAQLTPKLKASIMANTATKIVGGLSATDANTMAKEMGCDPTFLQSMRKTKKTTSFALWVQNQIPRPIELKVQLGVVDNQPKLADAVYAQLVEQNRQLYCVLPEDDAEVPEEEEINIPEASSSEDAEEVVIESEDASPDHRTIQSQIRALAHALGFHVTIEKPVAGGKRIDVVLERSDVSIACEISCTTKPTHEIANIKKCLDAGFNQIWSIAPNPERLKAIRLLARARLSAEDFRRITFLETEQLEAAFAGLPKHKPSAAPKTVAGYEVEVRSVPISETLCSQ